MSNAVVRTWNGTRTIEGAGVVLTRMFGDLEAASMDPFLLLDDFGSDNPAEYNSGFPWHPHRGIETVTYVLAGDVEHGDSIGNRGTIGAGDVQWMTAGSGVVHQEMPQFYSGRSRGFQLWVNLPASHKMMDPRYRGVLSSEIPEIEKEGVRIKVIAGEIQGAKGPIKDLVVDAAYFDVTVPPGVRIALPVNPDHTVFAFVFEGSGSFGDERIVDSGGLVLFEKATRSVSPTYEAGGRFLLVTGRPIGEPIAWRGSIVMNTEEELDQAFKEYREDTFIR